LAPTQQESALSARERRTRLAGVETRTLSIEGDGPSLLLLHGYADSADTWRPLLRRLAASERAAMAVDLTGFGTAEPLEAGSPMLPQWDRVVRAAIEQLSEDGRGEVIVVGNSLGGALSLRAAQSPELPIAGIVPIAPAGLHMAHWFGVIETERLIRLLRRSPLPVPETLVRQIVARVYRELAFHDRAGADRDVIASFSRHIGTLERSMGVLDIGRRLLPELEEAFDLRSIDCPLLLVWGDRDRMVYTDGAERVLRAVDYSDIEIIPDCGHCPQVEVPDRLAEILLGFPDSLEYARPARLTGPGRA
jgi:pimeloyl-ACP methyl ester carboxylesterase